MALWWNGARYLLHFFYWGGFGAGLDKGSIRACGGECNESMGLRFLNVA